MLREGCPHQVYCSDMVFEDLTTGFPLFNMLKHWDGGVDRHRIPLSGESFAVDAIDGLSFTAIPVTGKAPPYSPHRNDAHIGDNIGIKIVEVSTGKSVFYAPGLGEITDETRQLMSESDCLLVDGTFWSENEMQKVGLGNKLASDMGHLPQSGTGGMLEVLRPMEKPRKILIHINNTNPILNEESEQRLKVVAEGIEVAYDGMEVEL